MTRGRSIQSFREEPADIEARIVEAIQQVGPRNVTELSRLTGAHPETVRYKVKRQFRRLGFRIHAEASYRRIGLVPYWAELRLSPKLRDTPRTLFLGLNKSCYLVYYAKLMPQGNFVGLFSIPQGRESEHRKLLTYMCEKEILRGFSLNEITASRHPAMNPRFFNFQSGKWEVDWNTLRSVEGSYLENIREKSADVDYQDLLLVKELQLDALQHVVSIANKVKVRQKTLDYHYREHLLRKKLISGFLVRWQHDIETSVSHATLMTRLTFRNLERELRSVQRAIGSIPFLWSEDLQGDGTYIANIQIPVQEATSTFEYLNSRVPDLYGNVELSFVKRSEASAFTVPHHMFEDGWKYDLEVMKRTLR